MTEAPLAPDRVPTFVQGGHAIFTVLNTRTGGRYTYKVIVPKQADPPNHRQRRRGAFVRFWVYVLTGSDNNTDYSYLGWTAPNPNGFVYDEKRAAVPALSPSVRGFDWFWRHRYALAEFPHVQVWHTGRCGRCGRLLTDPTSVEMGIGPICAAAT